MKTSSPRIRTHRDLIVWRKAMELARLVYGVTENFPSAERFGLSAQMRRASVSIPANIAEGRARTTTRDYVRFLAMALGSLRELETCCELSQTLELARKDQVEPAANLASEVGAMLARMSFTLRRRMAP